MKQSQEMTTSFNVDEFYSHEEIYASLGVGNAGGLRISVDEYSLVKRMVVFTSAPTARQLKENPYHDRVEGDILVYTGTGKEGDQSLSGVNLRIAPQRLELFPIYGFMIMTSRRDRQQGPKRWRFLGMLEYLRHYQDFQIDVRGLVRNTWLFEFRIHCTPQTILVDDDRAISATLLNRESSQGNLLEDDRQVAISACSPESDSVYSVQMIEQIRSRLLRLDPRDFEFVIRDVLLRTNFDDVTVTKYSQDGGIDLNAYPSGRLWPIGGMLVQVQAKRWLHTVGRKDVAELRGSLEPYARGVLVTTSHFSKAATLEAASSGKNPIGLIDGIRFASIIHSLEDFSLPE